MRSWLYVTRGFPTYLQVMWSLQTFQFSLDYRSYTKWWCVQFSMAARSFQEVWTSNSTTI